MNHKTSHRISYWVRRNRYDGRCVACGIDVDAATGWTQKHDDAWVTYCHACASSFARALPDGDMVRTMAGDAALSTHICCNCTRRVALTQSRNGRWYFCDVNGGNGISRPKARPWIPHVCPDLED